MGGERPRPPTNPAEGSMTPALPVLCAALLVQAAPVETKFAQVAPVVREGPAFVRSAGQRRAVVLIHGLYLHPFNSSKVPHAAFVGWQRPEGVLVRSLALDSDVFAFAYRQSVAVDDVAALPDLGDAVRRLRRHGYSQIVLVGFSAGGLVARQFVEDHPDAGVTKVVQICAPNAGSSWARLKMSVRANQEVYLQSLTKEGRQQRLRERVNRVIPDDVEFVCVVGTGMVNGDGIVATRCQWPDDLQRQGVPAVPLRAVHPLAMHTPAMAQTVAELVRTEQPRWDPARVAVMRRQLWGN